MPRYAAFLRAVNLGRNRRVSGAELSALFEEMGFEDVASFRTSGNVVFEAGGESAAKLTARIEKDLERALGHEARTFLRTRAEIEALAAAEPFERSLVEASKGKLQVSLLADKPAAGARKQIEALATEDDRLAFGERELYWLPSRRSNARRSKSCLARSPSAPRARSRRWRPSSSASQSSRSGRSKRPNAAVSARGSAGCSGIRSISSGAGSSVERAMNAVTSLI
jgi:uncharacterized protein (DUF1697 family)